MLHQLCRRGQILTIYNLKQLRRSIHVVRTVSEMWDLARLNANKTPQSTVGFVPTMGALHSGHMGLVQEAKAKNDLVYASIFVNPTQFSAGEDLDKYPRQFESDMALLEKDGVDVVFAPSLAVMYGDAKNKMPLCHVEPRAFSEIHEGRARPDFFRGVATVVTKLFNIVRPDDAYFGQKDISQCILVRRLVQDLSMPVRVHVCPTARDKNGLALSSRNAYLTPTERERSCILYKSLSVGKSMCEEAAASGVKRVSKESVLQAMRQVLAQEPMVTEVEYISFASPSDMRELEHYSTVYDTSNAGEEGEGVVISAAIRIGAVRLIDNVLVGSANDIFKSHH